MRATIINLITLGLLYLAVGDTRAQAVTREQVIPLQAGWNAVFLEVHPLSSEPEAVFGGTPVEIAATIYAPVSTAQFTTDPGTDLLRQAGWGVWYAAGRADSFLSSLHSIYGQRAYLLYAKSEYVWKIKGEVLLMETRWQPDAFNFVGFPVRAQGGPTFAQFFSGSKAHKTDRIFRLVGGVWKRVGDASAETMRSGEAFWIYCEGGSKFEGPLNVQTTTRRGIVLGTGSDSINLRNDANYPVGVTMEHIVTGPDPVALSLLINAVGDEFLPVRVVSTPLPDGAWVQPLPTMEVGGILKVPFEARVGEAPKSFRSSMLKISTDIGSEIYIPIVNTRPDLEIK